MMMKIVHKETICLQLKEVTLHYLEGYYSQSGNREKLIMIYDNETYWTVISYYMLRPIYTEYDLKLFLDVKCCHEYLSDENEMDWAEQIYQHIIVSYIPIAPKKVDGEFSQKYVQTEVFLDKEMYENVMWHLLQYLKMCNITFLYIKLPDDDNTLINRHKFNYYAADSLMWRDCNRTTVIDILEYITNKNYEEAKKAALSNKSLAGKTLGRGKKKIFLVGGCIANGWVGFKGDDLATILSDVFYNKYEIQCVSMMPCYTVTKYQLLEYDINSDDLVIVIDQICERWESDIDVASLFNSYDGGGWLYYDVPIHTTRYGNELLARAIAEKIICAGCGSDKEKMILHKGKPQLSCADEDQIEAYCVGLPKPQKESNVGAIVMNCNPFTLGHRYLVEFASKQVDFLYLFVVEEDASEFTFEERFEMVKEGVRDLKFVEVVPSGKFILSKDSFKNYFEKERIQGVSVDASKDLYIFAEYVAPRLGITKRFVGEEPLDMVTKQYNLQMKTILGEAGIEVQEIQRKKNDDGIISASKVRSLLKSQDWDLIEKYVPETTMRYLRRRAGTRVSVEKKMLDKYEQKMLNNMFVFIRDLHEIILYGTGQDAQGLFLYFSNEIVDKIQCCDRRADREKYTFMGRQVISPSDILMGEKTGIIVSSTKYKCEIHKTLIEMGIDRRKIYFNSLSFGCN